MKMSSLLEIRDLKVNYGGIEALKGVSFDVKEGEIVTLIGANGAGKSTTLRAIMSVVNPASGTISYEGKDITHAATHDIVQRGIVLVPEGRRVFPNLTVLENLRIGAYLREDKDAIEHDIEHVYSLFPRLNERHWQQAGTLSGGEQQMLAICRGLMAKPKILMLDEPSLGLAPVIVNDVFRNIQRIRDEGITVILVEQNAKKSLSICDYAYVIETGRVVMSGTGKEMLENPEVAAAYLGSTRNQ